jgi:hypothetical protein
VYLTFVAAYAVDSYDHEDDNDYVLMKAKEEEVLRTIGDGELMKAKEEEVLQKLKGAMKRDT